MLTKRVCLILSAFSLLLFGCATAKVQVSSPEVLRTENPMYTIRVEPLKSGSGVFDSFRLELTNTSAAELEIDWNKSRYLYNGKDAGVFVFEGIDPSAINSGSVEPDIVSPGHTFAETIGPYRLIAKAPLKDRRKDVTAPGLTFGPIPVGRSGIHLVVRQGSREFTETLTVTIRETERG